MAHVPPTLKKGSEGEAVKGLQNALNVRGYGSGGVDGEFGPTTEKGVKKFQGDAGLDVDGVVGPNTWEALVVYVVQSGDTLSSIAEEVLGDASRWPEIHEINTDIVADPDVIRPGQVLVLPSGC